jgi:hypothetical protein
MAIALLLAAVGSLIAAIGCAILARSVIHARKADLARRLSAMCAVNGLWVGAWLVAVREHDAEVVQGRAREAALRSASPREVLLLWEQAGGRVVVHMSGPAASDEARAQAWIRQSSNDLLTGRIPALVGLAGQRLFAIFYASPSAPPIDGGLQAIGTFVSEGAGAAFVACPEDRARSTSSSSRGRARFYGALALALGVAAGAFVAAYLIFRPSAPIEAGPESSRREPVGTATVAAQPSASVATLSSTPSSTVPIVATTSKPAVTTAKVGTGKRHAGSQADGSDSAQAGNDGKLPGNGDNEPGAAKKGSLLQTAPSKETGKANIAAPVASAPPVLNQEPATTTGTSP